MGQADHFSCAYKYILRRTKFTGFFVEINSKYVAYTVIKAFWDFIMKKQIPTVEQTRKLNPYKLQ